MNNMINLHEFDKNCSLWYNIIVRVIRGYGKMKGYVLEYVCENEFKKLERALKKYNMLAFKKLNFDYYKNLLLSADWCKLYKMTGTPNLLQWQVYKYVKDNML